MRTSQQGIDLVKRFEGFSPVAYLCPAGVWTIGYGHTADVHEGDSIDGDTAEDFLREDLTSAEGAVEKYVKVPLKQWQFDALVSFTFNLGAGNLYSSTLLKKVNRNPDDTSIRQEFEKWVYAGGRVLQGLVDRRKAEADMYFG